MIAPRRSFFLGRNFSFMIRTQRIHGPTSAAINPSHQAKIKQTTLAPIKRKSMIVSGEVSKAAILVKGTVKLKRMMHKSAARMFMISL